MKRTKPLKQARCLIVFLLPLVFCRVQCLFAYPIHFLDSGGSQITIAAPPQRVVSLVPAVTEILFQLGAGKAVKGVTYNDNQPPEVGQKEIMGGFFAPSAAAVDALAPDVIFVSSLHTAVRDCFKGRPCTVIQLESRSLQELYANIQLLGRIFAKETQAEEIVAQVKKEMRLVAEKIAKIPPNERKRVMRFMGRDRVMTPGDDSFQNEFIRAAGGVPPQLGKNGSVVDVTLKEWQQFNPQVIYDCGQDRAAVGKLLSQPGWKDVEAVRTNKIFYFPCNLTCRNSVHSSEFVAWLASTIYEEQFSTAANQVLEEKPFHKTPVDLPLDYIHSANVAQSTIFDFTNKTLVVEFKHPMRIVSTLEGERNGMLVVGNHYTPPPCWGITHHLGLAKSRRHIYEVIGKLEKTSCFLFTGADMGNLSVQERRFKDIAVYALVTAGVETNAVRMSMDQGRFYELGTINVIVLTNMRLTPRAMTRAIISATEAKTAAMEDLDVRSCSSPRVWQATGTGTDEVLVVEGDGVVLDNAGGHSKLGELIAGAVYAGVKEAVYRQNGITVQRNVFRRLQERRINLYGLLQECSCFAEQTGLNQSLVELEAVLLQPRYASFMEAAFALSDAYERGLIINLEGYQKQCRNIAEEIAGDRIASWKEMITAEDVPPVLRLSLNALLNGVSARVSGK